MPPTTRGTEKRDVFWAVRLTRTEKDGIEERAKRADMTMTDYVVRASLGKLADPSTVDQRVDELEERIQQLEKLANLGAFG